MVGEGSIPAFLQVDVEPTGTQPNRDDADAWSGCAPTLAATKALRRRIEDASGAPARLDRRSGV